MLSHPRQLEFQLFEQEPEPKAEIPITLELPFDGDTSEASQTEEELLSDELPTAEELIAMQENLQKEARSLANKLGLSRLAMTVSVRWNYRMRTTAGRAYYRKSLIELNPRLMTLRSKRAEEIDRTMKHELAHLVAFSRAGTRSIQPHGPEWKRACAELGIPGEDRCHQLPFKPRRLKRKFHFRCPVCKSEVHRVRNFKTAVACYKCCKKHSRGRYDARFRLEKVE